MWSANILEVQKEAGRIIIEYVKGDERITEAVALVSATDVKSYIVNKVRIFETIDNDMPVVGSVDTTPLPVVEYPRVTPVL